MEDLLNGIVENQKKLSSAIKERYKIAVQRARAEYLYRSALGSEMATAKLEGMAATALYEYCRGLENIAKLRCDRDILQAREDYLTEMIFYYRAEIRIAENQVKAERSGL